MRISLNGNLYELEAGGRVTRTPLIEWPENTRLDGQQQRKDRSQLSSYVIDRWVDGLGIERQNVDLALHQFRLWDAENVDTRHQSFIVLSPELQTPTIVPSRGDLDVIFQHIDQLYFAQGTGNVAHQFTSPDTLGSFSRVGFVGSSIFPNQIAAVRAFGANLAVVERDFAAAAYTYFNIATMGGDNVGSRFLLSGDRPVLPQIGDFGGTVHIIEYRPTSKSIRFHIANQDLGSLTAVATIAATVGSYLSPLVTDGVTMFAQIPQGIFDFDVTPAILIDTSRDLEQNAVAEMFRNQLLFKNSKSLMNYDGAGIVPVGYDLDDGLKGEKFGEITAMISTWKSTFAAVHGATYSHILSWDNLAWQYYARVPTPGIWVRDMLLSNSPDGIDRLWLVFGNHPFPGYFINPIINPLQAGTYAYVPTGHFTKPIYDGGMAEEPTAFYNMGLTADGMGGSNIITALYGLDGALPVTTLGVVASTFSLLTFGSPYGVEGRRIQPEFWLAGANSGTSPIFREATFHFLKSPDIREMFDFTVDLEATAIARTRPLESVIGSLNSERGSKILMPFWYGRIGTKAVKVLDMPSLENVEQDRVFDGDRSGFVNVRLSEIL